MSINDKLPRFGKWVMVEAPSVRCLGFLDRSGGAMHVTVTLLKMFSRGPWFNTAPATPLAKNPVHLLPGSPPLRPKGNYREWTVRLVMRISAGPSPLTSPHPPLPINHSSHPESMFTMKTVVSSITEQARAATGSGLGRFPSKAGIPPTRRNKREG